MTTPKKKVAKKVAKKVTKKVVRKGKPQGRFLDSTAKRQAKEEKELLKNEQEMGKLVESEGLRLSWIKFIDAYIANGGNGKLAYMVAYPDITDENTAAACASRLLRNDNVRAELNSKLNASRITEELIQEGLLSIATEYRGAKTIMAAVKSYEILGKMKGLLVDTKKIAFTGENPALFPALVKPENKEKFDEMVKKKERIAE